VESGRSRGGGARHLAAVGEAKRWIQERDGSWSVVRIAGERRITVTVGSIAASGRTADSTSEAVERVLVELADRLRAQMPPRLR
jgi:hypothetical protein